MPPSICGAVLRTRQSRPHRARSSACDLPCCRPYAGKGATGCMSTSTGNTEAHWIDAHDVGEAFAARHRRRVRRLPCCVRPRRPRRARRPRAVTEGSRPAPSPKAAMCRYSSSRNRGSRRYRRLRDPATGPHSWPVALCADGRGPRCPHSNDYDYVAADPIANTDLDGRWCRSGVGTTCTRYVEDRYGRTVPVQARLGSEARSGISTTSTGARSSG